MVQMNRRAVLAIGVAVVGVCALLGGCAPTPSLEVVDATLIDASPEAVVVAVRVRATNIGEDGLPLRLATYTISAGGKSATVTRSPEATLRARGAQEFIVPAALLLNSSERAAMSDTPFTISGTVSYVPPGRIPEVFFDMGIYRPSASMSGGGTVNLAGPTRPAPLPDGKSMPELPRE